VAESTSGQDRTELATPRRRERARERGNVARSMEISSVVVFTAGILGLHAFGPSITGGLAELLRGTFATCAGTAVSADSLPTQAADAARTLALAVLPLAGLVALAGIVSQVVQVGVLFTTQPLEPQWERVSPIAGFKRIVSKRSLVELLKSIAKIGIVAALVVGTLADAPRRLFDLSAMEPAAAFAVIAGLLLKMAAAACVALALLALLDLLFQRWDYEKQLMMTRQEVRQEHKETEGDPIVKAFLRSMQRDVSRRRMMESVKKADVVVTNPVHYAVALRYDPSEMGAPRVVAKGARLVAKRIREIAVAAGVPVVEDPPLARALHKSCRVGAQVPIALYKAVADLLAFVYRARERRQGAGVGA
jgi:flagellar biosynthetic protein FlhB